MGHSPYQGELDQVYLFDKYPDYRAYLGGPEWAELRERVFKKKWKFCYACGKPASQVHHRNYKRNTMRGRRLRDLLPLCRGCHHWAHYQAKSLKETNELLKARRMVRYGGRLTPLGKKAKKRQEWYDKSPGALVSPGTVSRRQEKKLLRWTRNQRA